MKYINSITWGQYAHGRLTPRSLMSYFQTFPTYSRVCIMLLAKIIIHSIIVLNKAYLHFHVTSIHSFKIFSTKIIASFGHDDTWQNLGVKRPHSWAFYPKQWWAFCPEGIFFFLDKRTSFDSSRWNEIDMEWMKTILSIIKSLQISITVRKV